MVSLILFSNTFWSILKRNSIRSWFWWRWKVHLLNRMAFGQNDWSDKSNSFGIEFVMWLLKGSIIKHKANYINGYCFPKGDFLRWNLNDDPTKIFMLCLRSVPIVLARIVQSVIMNLRTFGKSNCPNVLFFVLCDAFNLLLLFRFPHNSEWFVSCAQKELSEYNPVSCSCGHRHYV